MAGPTTSGPTSGPVPALDQDDIQRMRFRKAMARKKRLEREREGEIKELNITAMMDMMTIILVFLIKSYSASSVTVTPSEDLRPPVSSARLTPRDTIAVTITGKAILVNDKPVVMLVGGQPAPETMQGALILPLNDALQKRVDMLKGIEARNPAAVFAHEVSIIGDKRVPYQLLSAVLYTAGRNELQNFRFVVISKDNNG